MLLPDQLKSYFRAIMLTAGLAVGVTLTAPAQDSSAITGKKEMLLLPAPKTNSFGQTANHKQWSWQQYLPAVKDSSNSRSLIYEAYPSHHHLNNYRQTSPFRWNDVAGITAMALVAYMLSR
ncbi:hypothetical protein [Chitinophaga sp. ARDCPP14]|uniref:hypothetical protein n=1 Tax=Chitinophaga sp. ARDCPP14 TaxID=3391139 RepID=UPI003F51D8C5